MKARLQFLTFSLAASFVATPIFAGPPQQEKAFVDKYKAAFESGDKATLETFLYAQGANPTALQFFKIMQGAGIGGKIMAIALVPLTAEDLTNAGKIQDGPGGLKVKIPLKPVKKLKFAVEKKTGDTNTISTSEFLIAEKDGKLVIPVPVDAK